MSACAELVMLSDLWSDVTVWKVNLKKVPPFKALTQKSRPVCQLVKTSDV